MTELWDLVSYIEANPDDHPQRWRLAKKLFAASEYRHALEHLQILKKNWAPRLNVCRYLAATYYRLGRYSEAIAELEAMILQWPDEIGPRQQLAHVLTVDGKLDRALAVWEEILSRDPNHGVARKAAHKLKASLAFKQGIPQPSPNTPAREKASPSAATPLPETGSVCASCGAHNSNEFEVCWQCGRPFEDREPPLFNTPSLQAHGPLLLRPETLAGAAVIIICLIYIVNLYLGLRLWLDYRAVAGAPLTGLNDIYARGMAPSRLVTGLFIALFWPFALKLCMAAARAKSPPPALVLYLTGAFLGGITWLCSYLPPPLTLLMFMAPLFLSLLIVITLFRLDTPRMLLLWPAQMILVFFTGALIFWAAESYQTGRLLNPAREWTGIATFARESASRKAGPLRFPAAPTPVRHKLLWRRAGSDWLNARGARIQVQLRADVDQAGLRLQLYEGPRLRELLETDARHAVLNCTITPGTIYEIVVSGSDNVLAQVAVESLLPPEVP